MLTLDTKDMNVPELGSQGTTSHPEEEANRRAPVWMLGSGESSCRCGTDVRRGLRLPPELGDAGPGHPRAARPVDRARVAQHRPPGKGTGADGRHLAAVARPARRPRRSPTRPALPGAGP